jgi:hypothetical protein
MATISLMKRVFIASPFRGEREKNIRYLKMCIKDSLDRGEAPYAPHAYLPFLLDDDKPKERAQGILIGHKFLLVCSLTAVYNDYGISDGMQTEIDLAKAYKIPIQIRKLHS